MREFDFRQYHFFSAFLSWRRQTPRGLKAAPPEMLIQRGPMMKNAKTYTCIDCGKVYNYNRNLLAHRKYQCGKEPQFSCPHCGIKMRQRQHLRIHIRRKHPEDPASNPRPL